MAGLVSSPDCISVCGCAGGGLTVQLGRGGSAFESCPIMCHLYSHLFARCPRGGGGGGGGGGGILIIFLGGGVPPGPENPYPISDQNIRFSTPYFRPVPQNVYPFSDPVMCGKFGILSIDLRRTGLRDAPNDVRVFSSRSMSTATHVTLKTVSQTKPSEYTPYFRPKWQNLYPISD